MSKRELTLKIWVFSSIGIVTLIEFIVIAILTPFNPLTVILLAISGMSFYVVYSSLRMF